jgi:acyl-CoA thioesterase-2
MTSSAVSGAREAGSSSTWRGDTAPMRGAEQLDVVDLLALDRRSPDVYRGRCHAGAPMRAFGGQVAAQALGAAGRTVDRPPHSLHCTFLRPGDPARPVDYSVTRVRDGRTYASRVVEAIQGGQAIMTLTASFKHPEPDHDRQPSMPRVPLPDELPDPYPRWASANPDVYAAAEWRRAVSLRFVPPSDQPTSDGSNDQLVWMRAISHVPDDPVTQAAALTYFSDLTLAHTAAMDIEPHAVLRDGPRRTLMASLNHGVWFHRPFQADDWLLFAQRSRSTSDGRGLSMGEFWSRDGRLVASAAQEAVLRIAGSGPHASL